MKSYINSAIVFAKRPYDNTTGAPPGEGLKSTFGPELVAGALPAAAEEMAAVREAREGGRDWLGDQSQYDDFEVVEKRSSVERLMNEAG